MNEWLKKIGALLLGCLGLYWMIASIIVAVATLKPAMPGTRSDFEPWFLLILCVPWFGAGVLCVLAAISIVQKD